MVKWTIYIYDACTDHILGHDRRIRDVQVGNELRRKVDGIGHRVNDVAHYNSLSSGTGTGGSCDWDDLPLEHFFRLAWGYAPDFTTIYLFRHLLEAAS